MYKQVIDGSSELQTIGSYSEDDVIFLLKDIGHMIEEQETADREEAIQSGIHYSEMLPIEYQPTPEYIDLFHQSLDEYARKLAIAVGVVAKQIYEKKSENLVIVSLARAGTPIGILLKRFIAFYYKKDVPHYSVSIIRDRGIDENALLYILNKHPKTSIQFVDGWTGKGAITKELMKSCKTFYQKYNILLDNQLAVLADPGHCSNIYGTREDFFIPSACLNSTVSGLVSRTVLNANYISLNDFHGTKYYKHLAPHDVSNLFIDRITEEFSHVMDRIEGDPKVEARLQPSWTGLKDIQKIQKEYEIENMNLVKPGVGETTRVLLRRVPWKILVRKKNDPRLKHIYLLAQDKGVPIEEYQDMIYTCCGIIKPL